MKLSASLGVCALGLALLGTSLGASAAKPVAKPPVAKKAVKGKPAPNLKLSPRSRYYSKLKSMSKDELQKARARWKAKAQQRKLQAQKATDKAKTAKNKLLELLKKK